MACRSTSATLHTQSATTGGTIITTQKISPCLWFADEAEDAARFYTSSFKNSKITKITRYSDAGFEQHHRPAGSVMVVAFEQEGQAFTALNGGPIFRFNEAISFQVYCATQDEIDERHDEDEEARHRRASPSSRRDSLTGALDPGS